MKSKIMRSRSFSSSSIMASSESYQMRKGLRRFEIIDGKLEDVRADPRV